MIITVTFNIIICPSFYINMVITINSCLTSARVYVLLDRLLFFKKMFPEISVQYFFKIESLPSLESLYHTDIFKHKHNTDQQTWHVTLANW